ncbi:cupredoxin domain-containing protein [Niallia sp. 03133]|uniref:cupredoxin domain-containing protein n=1 Tax=Niallia sp. 03133 TaxID=3458060 RepID=UPI004043CABC
MRIVFIEKKWFIFLAICILLFVGGWFLGRPEAIETTGSLTTAKKITINMVTGEFKSTMVDGKEIEAYRWDPGTIYVPKGEAVLLSIYGVNGKEHPFYIEGTNIKGTVKKGKETVLNLRFKKEGVYRLICTTHHDINHNGPMIAYIIVD